LNSIGLDDFLGTEGVTVIEWGEKMGPLSEPATEVEIEDAGDDLRILRIKLSGSAKRSASRQAARGRKSE
jgi:tRNA A37 threonylcarbamoyladenosine biosynthesis protein TsaE